MKNIIILIIAVTSISVAAEDTRRSLLEEVMTAVAKKGSITLRIDGEGNKIRFLDEDDPKRVSIEPIILSLSTDVWRMEGEETRKVSVVEARDQYAVYATAARKRGIDPQLELWLSKHTDDALLKLVLQTVITKEDRKVWIKYFKSYPRRVDPQLIHKPIPPNKQPYPKVEEK